MAGPISPLREPSPLLKTNNTYSNYICKHLYKFQRRCTQNIPSTLMEGQNDRTQNTMPLGFSLKRGETKKVKDAVQ